MGVAAQLIPELAADPKSDQLGGRVLDRQQNAVFPRENPPPVFKSGHHFGRMLLDANLWMTSREQHPVIETVDDFLQSVAQRDEVEHVLILVERPRQFDGRPPIVTVQSFAHSAGKRNEMGRAEDQMVLGDPHGKPPAARPTIAWGDHWLELTPSAPSCR